MEKTLFKRLSKGGEFKINYLPKTFVFGYIHNHDSYYYVLLGCFSFEWFSYSKNYVKK